MSPFAVLWIAVDVAALVLMAAAFARREQRTAFDLRALLVAQMVVVASAIAALMAIEPLRAYAEWTLMVAVNIGYALTAWRGGAAARSLATMAIVATTVAVALIALKSFASIVVVAIALVFAIGALFASLLPTRERARA
jgi:hypothetical protein